MNRRALILNIFPYFRQSLCHFVGLNCAAQPLVSEFWLKNCRGSRSLRGGIAVA